MEVYNRKSVMANLKDFDHLSKEHDYIEVAQWNNGEGWDIFINERASTARIIPNCTCPYFFALTI